MIIKIGKYFTSSPKQHFSIFIILHTISALHHSFHFVLLLARQFLPSFSCCAQIIHLRPLDCVYNNVRRSARQFWWTDLLARRWLVGRGSTMIGRNIGQSLTSICSLLCRRSSRYYLSYIVCSQCSFDFDVIRAIAPCCSIHSQRLIPFPTYYSQ